MNDGSTWIVVADGGRARCFEERRRGVALRERADFALAHTADDVVEGIRPGRIHESWGAARHAVERGPDPHQTEEDHFLHRVVDRISAAAGDFDHLVILAPPRALGLIRAALPKAVADKVALSHAVDVVRESAVEIAARLDELRRPG